LVDTEKSSFQNVAKNLDSLNSEVLEQSYIVAARKILKTLQNLLLF
jgi:hypothetical protein